MANVKKQKKELLMTQAGEFYFGRTTKSGTISADSERITDDDLMKMLAAWFEFYCNNNNTNTMWIKTATGAILIKNLTEQELQQGLLKQKVQQAQKKKKAKPAPVAAPKKPKNNPAGIPAKQRTKKS